MHVVHEELELGEGLAGEATGEASAAVLVPADALPLPAVLPAQGQRLQVRWQ